MTFIAYLTSEYINCIYYVTRRGYDLLYIVDTDSLSWENPNLYFQVFQFVRARGKTKVYTGTLIF